MSRSKKIGVLTFHRCINYGSYWQARCLVEGLRRLGHDAVLLDHDCDTVNRAETHCALQPALPQRTPLSVLPAYKSKVRRFSEEFKRLPTSPRFPIDRPTAAGRYDAIVVGSDEVWNFRHPWYADKPIFFGESLQTDRLISYAASFGNHDADDGIRCDRARQLRQFSSLSVRDANSRRLIDSSVGRQVDLVLDPCLQFAEEIPAAMSAGRGYALVYGHSFPHWLQSSLRAWSERKDVRLVSVGYANCWADEQRIAAGPHEFAVLMAGAAAVVTNFFHGCVFALRGGRPFIAARSDYRSNKVVDLVGQVGAEERLVDQASGPKLIDDLLSRPPSGTTVEHIRDARQRSQDFLDTALA